MTIEKLLQCDANMLESFSDEQLLEWFKPMLVVTRPELAIKPDKQSNKQRTQYESNNKKQQAFELLKSMGIQVKKW